MTETGLEGFASTLAGIRFKPFRMVLQRRRIVDADHFYARFQQVK